MASKPNVAARQDMPPPGGYPKVKYHRDLRSRGPPQKIQWLLVLAATAYGFYQIGQTNRAKRQAGTDQRTARINLYPYLQYERDLALSKEIEERLAKEKELMKDNKEWVVGAKRYTKRWANPSAEF
eukprot:gene10862-11839_t